MSDLESVIPILKATILSTSGLVSIEQCNRDYKELQGEYIPYAKLGFKSLEELFKKIPGFQVNKQNGKFFVDTSAPREVEHITQMIARQKTAPPKKGYKKYIQRIPRRFNNDTSWKSGAPTNSWKPWKSPTKMPQSQHKPRSNTVNHYNGPPKAETVHNQPKFQQPAGKPAAVNPPKSAVKAPPAKLEQKTIPASKLSGLRPGDMLTRSYSTPAASVNGAGKELSSPTSVPPSPTTLVPSSITSSAPVSATAVPARTNLGFSRLSAADRMNALQNNLQKSEPTIIIPKIEDSKLKDNKSRLLRCCQEMGLPAPVYKTHEAKIKGRGPSQYDCTVKIGNVHSSTTYPDSQKTMDMAVEMAAGKAYARLQELLVQESQPCSPVEVAIQRIAQVLKSHPNGLFANTLPDMYKEHYNEVLPKDWLTVLDTCPHVAKEDGANGLTILLPVDIDDVIEKSSSSESTSERVASSLMLQPLQFPEEPLWNVFVMSAHSTTEIWFRIIGENHSEPFESLTADMEHHFEDSQMPSSNITEEVLYAINCEDCWVRARVLSVDTAARTAVCFFVDSGDVEEHPFNSIYDLPPEFCSFPPQAILCKLDGLEDLETECQNSHLSELVTGKVLVAEVLQVQDDNEDVTLTVVLFDTSTDIDLNINRELVIRMCKQAQTPKLTSDLCAVYLTNISTTGKVFVQIHNTNWRLLQSMMRQLVAGPFPQEALQASFGPVSPSPGLLYLVKSSSGEWRRAVFRSGISKDQHGTPYVSVRYIDYGAIEEVPLKDVLLLKRISETLNDFPPQGFVLTLANVTTISQEMIRKVTDWIPANTPVICKQVNPGTPIVELYVRTQPHNLLCSLNSTLRTEQDLSKLNLNNNVKEENLKPSITSNDRLLKNVNINVNPLRRGSESPTEDVPQMAIPEKDSFFNVKVSMAASPWNFVVQPYNLSNELSNMMSELQVDCKRLPEYQLVPVVGKVYAAKHTKETDDSWYRVRLQGIVSSSMASIYFIDFGDHSMVDLHDLRELPSRFRKYPGMAIKAKLYGVSPKNLDWSVEDCLRFHQLVENQCFVSTVKNIESDPLHKGEVLLVLNLVDTSTDEDLYLNVLLAKEGRAILHPQT